MKLQMSFTPSAITVAPDDPLALVAALLQDHNIGAVVVTEDQRPVGIITDRDLALALGANGFSLHSEAREIMSRKVLAIPDGTDFSTATQFMKERGVRRLPVVDSEDRLVGMITLDDLLGVLGREMANLAQCIRDEVHVK